MTNSSEESILAIVQRWRGLIMVSTAVGALLAGAYAFMRPKAFQSEASIGLPPSSPPLGAAQRLASLAGVTGVPFGQSFTSPDLLATVLVSPTVLDATLGDIVAIENGGELNGRPYGDVVVPNPHSRADMLETGRRKLGRLVTADILVTAQTVSVTARERSPALAQWLCRQLITHLDEAMRRARIADAAGRHAYLATQVSRYAAELRSAEEALMQFTVRNRSIDASPTLQLERMRLQRAVDVVQATYLTMLTQRDLTAAETSESAPQIVVYSSPTLAYRPSQVGWLFLVMVWALFAAGMACAVAIPLTAHGERLGIAFSIASALNTAVASRPRGARTERAPSDRGTRTI